MSDLDAAAAQQPQPQPQPQPRSAVAILGGDASDTVEVYANGSFCAANSARLPSVRGPPLFGSFAGFVGGTLMLCGGKDNDRCCKRSSSVATFELYWLAFGSCKLKTTLALVIIYQSSRRIIKKFQIATLKPLAGAGRWRTAPGLLPRPGWSPGSRCRPRSSTRRWRRRPAGGTSGSQVVTA